MYEMIACNVRFNFIPKELFYVKNNSSKYEFKLCTALSVSGTDLGDVTETAGVHWTAYGNEGLSKPQLIYR
jgi:hypothetical protein